MDLIYSIKKDLKKNTLPFFLTFFHRWNIVFSSSKNNTYLTHIVMKTAKNYFTDVVENITFTNLPHNNSEQFLGNAARYLLNTIESLSNFADNMDSEEVQEEFANYGLSFDFVEPGTFKDQDTGYYRYQLSWGGPGDEVRFFPNGLIEYVYLEPFAGIGGVVTNIPEFVWLREQFQDLGMLTEFDALPF